MVIQNNERAIIMRLKVEIMTLNKTSLLLGIQNYERKSSSYKIKTVEMRLKTNLNKDTKVIIMR